MTGRRLRSKQEGSFLEQLQCDYSEGIHLPNVNAPDCCFNMCTSAYAWPAASDSWCGWRSFGSLDTEHIVAHLISACVADVADAEGLPQARLRVVIVC